MTYEEATERIECILKNNSFTKADKNALKSAIEAIEKQATQEWISVDDRLPKFGVSVLARCFYHGKWRTMVCHTSKEHAGEWYTDEVCQWVKVTHWMPLPSELPNGE